MIQLKPTIVKVVQITVEQAQWLDKVTACFFITIPYHDMFLECEPEDTYAAIMTELSYHDKETVSDGNVSMLMWLIGVLQAHSQTDWLIMTIPKDE